MIKKCGIKETINLSSFCLLNVIHPAIQKISRPWSNLKKFKIKGTRVKCLNRCQDNMIWERGQRSKGTGSGYMTDCLCASCAKDCVQINTLTNAQQLSDLISSLPSSFHQLTHIQRKITTFWGFLWDDERLVLNKAHVVNQVQILEFHRIKYRACEKFEQQTIFTMCMW